MNQTASKFKRNLRIFLILLTVPLLITAAVWGIYDRIIPDRVSYFMGEDIPTYCLAGAEAQNAIPCAATQQELKTQSMEVQYKLFDLIPIKTVTAEAYQKLRVYPGGMPFGVKFFTSGVLVVGFSDIECGGHTVNPAQSAGLKQKDIITHINGQELADAATLTESVEASGGKPMQLTCLRGGKTLHLTVTPTADSTDGKYKTGILVRDSGAGIGTVSFILPENNYFVGLGHGICDTETGDLVPIRRGTVVDVTISGIHKGISGTPGEIKGFFTAGKKGMLLGNTNCGVYGILSERPTTVCEEPMPIALKDELREGEAYILCTLDESGIGKYQVEISAINRNATEGKCFTVKVTDKKLLEKTGGIIQGMSGSPIIQNGKLVGAVTHVMINDPCVGYGIFVENMLNITQIPMLKES